MSTNPKRQLTLPIFLEFVELRTKVASIFPMLLGMLWSAYRYQTFAWLPSLLFALAVVSFDMCTTAINNTVDFYKAKDKVYQEQENVLGKFGLDLGEMVRLVVCLLAFSVLLSLCLVWQTSWVLLPMGMVCFGIGIGYTFGPLPLSRMPLGELFSGLTMGFAIFFLAIYIQEPTRLLEVTVTGQWLDIRLAWPLLLEIAGMSLPLVTLISAIMLANNICDLETDIRNQRYTLVYYIGKKNALILYSCLTILPWLAWLVYGLTGLLPLWSLVGLVAILPAYRSLKTFRKRQIKSQTFVESVKSFVLFSSLYLLVLCLALFLR